MDSAEFEAPGFDLVTSAPYLSKTGFRERYRDSSDTLGMVSAGFMVGLLTIGLITQFMRRN